MNILDLIKERRSIRKFKTVNIPESEIKELIEAAISAPSAGNIQPWEFIVVRRKEIKTKLADAALGQKFIEAAPLVIVVCANTSRSAKFYGSRGVNLYCLQDTAAAIQNMLLLSKSKKIGSCWIGAFSEDAVSEILNIPSSIRPIAIIPFGYPEETPHRTSRRSLEEVVHYESF
jgi:nitroreductase